MNSLWRNIRYAIRVFLKKPVLACVAVIVLALGIGASTAIFSVVSALLIRPLPYSQPDRLAVIWETWLQKGLSQIPVFIPDFLYWKDNSKAFESIAAFKNVDFNITGGEPERVSSARVSAGFFPTFGVSPLLGRTFLPAEDQYGGIKSVVLSYGLWQRRYGSDRTIINKTITLNDVSYSVVGVMPPEFRFSIEWSMAGTKFPSVELWVPLALSPAESTSRSGHDLTVIGRLKPGVNWRQAQAHMDMLADNLAQLQPEVNTGIGSNVVPLHSQSAGDIKSSLLILSGAVAFVLLIACANVANLQLAQSLTRRQEIAIRIALGAGRRHIIGQLLTESILLAVVGGGLGVLLALWTTNSLIALSPTELGRGNKIVVDLWVMSFTLVASFLAGIISGLAPAFIFSKPDLNESLKGQGRTSTHAGFRRTSGLLVIWEVALALVLIVSAGLLIKSTSQLQKVDPGFNPRNLLTLKLSLPDTRYPEAGKQAAFFSQVGKNVEALPGVQGVAVSSNLPFEESWEILFTIEGRPEVSVRETPIASNHSVSPDYFRLMGIPLKGGRYFTEHDTSDSTKGVIIDENLARRYWPGESPLGKRIKRGTSQSQAPWLTIVGLVNSVRQYGLDSETKPEMYMSYLQTPRSTMSVILKTANKPETVTEAVRQEIWRLDKDQPIYSVRTFDQIVSRSLSARHFSTVLLSLFALVALVLAAVGVYGVIAFSVSQRTREIGIRMALGAQRRSIFGLVLRHGIQLAVMGVVIGLAGAFAATRILSTLLYGVSITDPATFLLVPFLLIVVSALACYVPARRASKVDPLIAIRCE